MFKKALGIIKKGWFIILVLLALFFILCVLFWIFGPSISFNDIYIFGSPYLRLGIILASWIIIFLIFLLKPTMEFFASLKSEKNAKIKSLKKESSDSVFKAKRNFFIALKDAKITWKNKIKFKKLPLIIIVGEEGAGKSTFINYSNIEYPLSDTLQSHKKFHQSTNNFSLYVSKSGALLDTEGNYFSQEKFFAPTSSDEIPEDDLDKNKDFLIKKSIWDNFLHFLNKNLFYSKLNGIVLVVDTQLFLNNPKEYSQNIIRYLVRRINDCENALNVKLPIYVIFSKLDLLDGMREFFEIFNEKIANMALGISFADKLNVDSLDKNFKQVSQSLLLNFTSKNHFLHSIGSKNKAYLFLKQLDNLFALAKTFILEIQKENTFKNNSFLRGVYFVSAYQENIPRNFLLDNICDKYNIKKALAKVQPLHNQNKQSYFVKSLLEDIIFKDYSLSGMSNIFKKFSTLLLGFVMCLGAYYLSFYFIAKNKAEKQKAENTLIALRYLINDIDHTKLNIKEKANLLADLKLILGAYPELSKHNNLIQYPTLNISYKGFIEARDFYDQLNEVVLKNTLLAEMEYILQNSKGNKDNLIKTLYVYKSLFNQKYLNKNLIKIWVKENWHLLEKYKISKENFLSGIDDIQKIDIENLNSNKNIIPLATRELHRTTNKAQRMYVLFIFLSEYDEFYIIKDKLGFAANSVFAESSNIDSINKIYTKNGLMAFLKNLNQNIDNMLNVESWLLESADNLTKENKNMLVINILKMHLVEYQNKWENLLMNLAPKQYASKESMLNELDALSKKDNPILALIRVVSTNTNLNDPLLLREAYNTALNASEIKTHFTNIANFFSAYHKIAQQDSLLSAGASAVGLNINNDEKIMETISADIKNIQSKIIDFSTSNTQSIDSKIIYALNGKKEQDDPFATFANDIKKLPSAIEKYYATLYTYAWNLIELQGIDLFNVVWVNEVWTPFMNDIAPFYPFNNSSMNNLSIDSLKGFFGRTGTLNKFYNKYLSTVLSKKADTHTLNTQFGTKINFSKNFLDFMRDTKKFSDLLFDSNDNIKLNFTLQSLDLSSDFSFVELQYNTHNMKYDHTIQSTLQIIADQFSSSTSLTLKAIDYHNSKISYDKIYSGEWAWHRFLKESQSGDSQSIIFNNNEKLYFDFKVTSGANEVQQMLKLPQQIKIVEHITIGENR